jgi:hypothetical protein
MKKLIVITGILIGLGFAYSVSAQTPTPRVAHKQVNQQTRINQGRATGELTPRETAGLEMQQAKIRHDKRMAKSDGVVTPRERRKLHREQRRASKNIAVQKHDRQKRN